MRFRSFIGVVFVGRVFVWIFICFFIGGYICSWIDFSWWRRESRWYLRMWIRVLKSCWKMVRLNWVFSVVSVGRFFSGMIIWFGIVVIFIWRIKFGFFSVGIVLRVLCRIMIFFVMSVCIWSVVLSRFWIFIEFFCLGWFYFGWCCFFILVLISVFI